jgi:hypothetical protein
MAADTTTKIPSHNAQAPPTVATPGTRRLGPALIVISLAQLMLVLDELIVNTALPHIQRALHFSGTGLEWVVTGYAVTFGGLLMLGGRAGEAPRPAARAPARSPRWSAPASPAGRPA